MQTPTFVAFPSVTCLTCLVWLASLETIVINTLPEYALFNASLNLLMASVNSCLASFVVVEFSPYKSDKACKLKNRILIKSGSLSYFSTPF